VPPVSITAIFSGSEPKTIWYRIDKSGDWCLIQQPIIFGNQATFSMPFGTLLPKFEIEIKLVNIAGESLKSLNILPGPKEQLKRLEHIINQQQEDGHL